MRVPVKVPWRDAVVGAVPVWAGVKVLVMVLTAVALRLRANPFLQAHGYMNEEGPKLHASFWTGLQSYDSTYYGNIALFGYLGRGVSQTHQAFFPGYPLAVRVLTNLFGGPYSLSFAMWLISTVASLVAAVVLWRFAAERSPGSQGWTVLLFLAGPYSVFLSASYSEAMFSAFAIAAWYYAHRDRWGLAAGFAAAATFTRSNGLFLVAGMLVGYLILSHRRGRPLLRPALAWLPVSLLGVGSYFAWLWWRTGDPFAWNTAQVAGWGRHSSLPWVALRRSVELVPTVTEWDLKGQYILDVVFGLALILPILGLLWRRWWPEAVYVGASWFALVSSTTFQSVGRNSLTMFPVPMLLAGVFRRGPWPARLLLGTVWFGLFLFNLMSFALGGWTD